MDKITSGATTIAVLGSSDRDSADSLLLQHGAVLFRGLGVDSPAAFHEFVGTFGEPFTDYRHGNSPRVAVQTGVWTSTEYPAEYEISLHNELSYAHRWPSRLFFYCDRAPAGGGATPVSDSRAVLAGLSPGVRSRFTSLGIAYLQNLHGGFGLGKSWQDTYETGDRDEVERALAGTGAEFRWTDDDELRVRQVRPAVRSHPVTGEEVWFNQAEQWHVSSLPADEAEVLLEMASSDEELPLQATYGDGSPLGADDLREVRETAKRNECSFPWERGDVMMIDNLLVMHGRHAYTGNRRILVSMI
ncbi:TauD/TfdA family dioxygenase [Planobispora longispora]|uniref:Protein AmbD n=1 Tax=Planobispora longispora TaxID=28887 RepID=A0A8J3W7F3_9ACTN|nr:TauD/TfdA family dioxygenase [Planobispora longispora]GIH77776.1 protein AmbD [Planobispora longispora]